MRTITAKVADSIIVHNVKCPNCGIEANASMGSYCTCGTAFQIMLTAPAKDKNGHSIPQRGVCHVTIPFSVYKTGYEKSTEAKLFLRYKSAGFSVLQLNQHKLKCSTFSTAPDQLALPLRVINYMPIGRMFQFNHDYRKCGPIYVSHDRSDGQGQALEEIFMLQDIHGIKLLPEETRIEKITPDAPKVEPKPTCPAPVAQAAPPQMGTDQMMAAMMEMFRETLKANPTAMQSLMGKAMTDIGKVAAPSPTYENDPFDLGTTDVEDFS